MICWFLFVFLCCFYFESKSRDYFFKTKLYSFFFESVDSTNISCLMGEYME